MSQQIKEQIRSRVPWAVMAYRKASRRLTLNADDVFSRWVVTGRGLCFERHLHQVTFDPSGVWIRDGSGLEWAYDPAIEASAGEMAAGLVHEPNEIEWITDNVPPGSLVVDIGANIGAFAVPLAKAGLRVLAIEAVASTSDLLRRNVARNQVSDSVTVVRAAASDKPGSVRVTTMLAAGNHLAETSGVGGTEIVDAVTADSLVSEAPALVKCDVEGAELAAMRGAAGVLGEHRPLLMLEVEARWTARYCYTPQDLFEFLSDQGYRCRGGFVDGKLDPGAGLDSANNFVFAPN